LWEAFLLQMNDFDRFLELELKSMLDPVVARRPPTRRGRDKEAPAPPFPAVDTLAVEPIPVAEPLVVVTLPVAPAHSL
jgi:hypothetical protein